jgi:hypothetical protein
VQTVRTRRIERRHFRPIDQSAIIVSHRMQMSEIENRFWTCWRLARKYRPLNIFLESIG